MSYWHKDIEDMKVLKDMKTSFLVKLLLFTYKKFHASRSCTKGLGMNVYDGEAFFVYLHFCISFPQMCYAFMS